MAFFVWWGTRRGGLGGGGGNRAPFMGGVLLVPRGRTPPTPSDYWQSRHSLAGLPTGEREDFSGAS